MSGRAPLFRRGGRCSAADVGPGALQRAGGLGGGFRRGTGAAKGGGFGSRFGAGHGLCGWLVLIVLAVEGLSELRFQ